MKNVASTHTAIDDTILPIIILQTREIYTFSLNFLYSKLVVAPYAANSNTMKGNTGNWWHAR